jgi:hypothetical protein
MQEFSRASHNKGIRSRVKTRTRTGTPDRIYYNKDKEFFFDSKNARAIIYFLDTDEIFWSEESGIHNDLLFNMSDKDKERNGIGDVLFVDELEDYDNVRTGRIWVIPNNKSKNRKFDVYIAWWEELTEGEFNKCNKNVIKQYKKDFGKDIFSAMIVDNNGKFVLFDGNEYLKITEQSKNREEDLFVLKQIHLASQAEKHKYLRLYLNNRNKNNQEKYYNHTKSKTAAEYNHIKRIGDSLEVNNINTTQHKMKSLLDFILERQSITFSGTGANTDNYGQCIILAGGPGSGKGFIQNKILCNYKVYDVDELKKMYIKLAEKGKIADEYKYDLTKPEDVGKLHMAVKSRKWKGKIRDAMWTARRQKDSHSSGLLPNILFDMVSGEKSDIEEIVSIALPIGYSITVIWVLCNKETASIGNKIRERRVNDKVIDDGHDAAYKTMTQLFNNKWDDLTPLINRAWIGFSAGYSRKLEEEYAKNPVIKVKNSVEEQFNFDNGLIDKFLKHKMPIDYKFINKQLKSNDEEKRQQAENWVKIVGKEYQPDNVSESFEYNEDEILNKWTEELSEIL